ncbi:hypothetical protein EV182_000223 [Spiromyces aspiralis]|uniref:Uncharacterized protein n=1 Tax=Spiromyces aspiralis TaxID=68401 RepID=A0ACC1HKQ3_9FUNG|nr:hypothetical protein EV182_000223 [Spiromyces aspiralis]
MHSKSTSSVTAGFGLLAALRVAVVVMMMMTPSAVLAHSWVDCAKYNPDNTLCYGYGRGYPGRGNKDINTIYTYLFDGTPAHQPMCNPIQQAAQNYSALFPMAVAYPGETIYQAWEANGHIDNEHPTRIDILYYSDPNKEFMDYTERNTALKAGSMNFATDANCLAPSNPNSVCTGSFKVPENLQPGNVYHFAWFWYFDANPAGQQYSTCFDLKIVDKSEAEVYNYMGSPNLIDIGNNQGGNAYYTNPIVIPTLDGSGSSVSPPVDGTSVPQANPIPNGNLPPKCRRRRRCRHNNPSPPPTMM